MPKEHGVTRDLVRQFMRERDGDALGMIFARYLPRLRRLAKKALWSKKIPEPEYDADDLLDSAIYLLMQLVLE